MARRKGFGNPLSKALSKVLDEVGPEALDSFMDVATGPKKSKKESPSSSTRSTDWATRVPGTPRKR
jgi:hypothetical protein